MRKLAWIFALVSIFSLGTGFLVLASNNFVSNPGKIEIPIPVLPYQSIPMGEKLVYDISWIGVPVGTGELWVKEKTRLAGREVLHVVGTVETNGFVAAIYPVHDQMQSWIDAQTFESVQFEKNGSHGVKRSHEVTTFDAEKKTGHFESFDTGMQETFEITPPAHDAISVFYWARRQPLVPGKPVNTVYSYKKIDHRLEIDALRYERVRLHRRGGIDTILITPITQAKGAPEKRGRAWMNVTADSAQKPVQITFKAPFGTVVGVLKN